MKMIVSNIKKKYYIIDYKKQDIINNIRNKGLS
jgi:hypothetical protein